MEEKMEREPISPESIIEDLYHNQISSLLDDLFTKLSLKEYQSDEKLAYIIIKIRNIGYNPIVLNEVKRRYLLKGWGNIFYKLIEDTNEISFQLYFPQIKSTI